MIKRRVKDVGRAGRQGLQRRIACDRRHLGLSRGVVSFTFDDVPRSALTNGMNLLERYGVPPTMYVAMGLCEQNNNRSASTYLSPSDVSALARAGAHIGCHSYSHKHLRQIGSEGLSADATRNRELLTDLIGRPVEDFAFPYGEHSFEARRALGEDYQSLRSIDPGVNTGSVDLRLIKSELVSEDRFDMDRLELLLAQCEANRGWLVLFTHGITDQPGPHDLRPTHFEQVLRCIEQTSIEPLDVGTMRRRLRREE